LCHTPKRRDAGFKRPLWSERHPDDPDRPVARRAPGAFSAASGEDRQVPALAIFTPQKPRNHAKNAKIAKIANFLHWRSSRRLAIFKQLGDLAGLDARRPRGAQPPTM